MTQTEDAWTTALAESMREALDRMAMMDVEVDPTARVETDGRESLSVGMSLVREPAAFIELRLPKSLARQWAAAIAGVEEDELEEGDVEDGGCELLNMIAGIAKTRLGEQQIHFGLGIPKAWQTEHSEAETGTRGSEVHLRARSGVHPIELLLRTA